MKTCVFCGKEELRYGVQKDVYSYKGFVLTVDQPGLWCSSCKEGVFSGKDLQVTAAQIQQFHDQVDILLVDISSVVH